MDTGNGRRLAAPNDGGAGSEFGFPRIELGPLLFGSLYEFAHHILELIQVLRHVEIATSAAPTRVEKRFNGPSAWGLLMRPSYASASTSILLKW